MCAWCVFLQTGVWEEAGERRREEVREVVHNIVHVRPNAKPLPTDTLLEWVLHLGKLVQGIPLRTLPAKRTKWDPSSLRMRPQMFLFTPSPCAPGVCDNNRLLTLHEARTSLPCQVLWMRWTPSHLVTERVAAPQHAHVRSRPTPRSLSLAQMAETVLSMGLVPALCHSRMGTTGHGNMPLRSGNETAHTGHPVNLTKGLFLARWTLSQAGTLGCVSSREGTKQLHTPAPSQPQPGERLCSGARGGLGWNFLRSVVGTPQDLIDNLLDAACSDV